MLAWHYKPMGDFSLMVYNQDSKRQENNSDKNSINPRLIAQKLRWKNKFLNTTRLQVRPVPKMVQTHSHCFVSYVVLLETGSYFPNQTGYDLVIMPPPPASPVLELLLYLALQITIIFFFTIHNNKTHYSHFILCFCRISALNNW